MCASYGDAIDVCTDCAMLILQSMSVFKEFIYKIAV